MGTLGTDPDHLSFIDAFFKLSVWELKMYVIISGTEELEIKGFIIFTQHKNKTG